MKSILLIILLTAFSMIQTQQSLFETIGIAGNTTSKEEDQPQPMVHHNKDTITSLIEKLKEEIKTPFLKDNITAENIAKYIATLLSGNQFLNNLEVKDITELSKVEVRENIKVNGVFERKDITGFNWSKVPVVILEMGFMSNYTEDTMLSNPDYQKKLMNCVSEAIDEYQNVMVKR